MSDTKWVVFIDALSPRDLSHADFMSDTMDGELEAQPPRVTPNVMSEAYTGLSAAENGMVMNHRFGVGDPTRPEQSTVMERAQANGLDVLNLYMPYSIPTRLFGGSASIGTARQQQSAGPEKMVPQITVPGPSGDLIGDENHDVVFDHFADYTSQLFASARTLSPQFDVVFIGFRLIDSYCHFQYDTGPDGRHTGLGKRYRDKLANIIDIHLKQLEPKGDIIWFSDHGATKRTETFRVNKWLAENGYLDYTVDESFRSQAEEYGMIQGEQHPIDTRVENQYVLGAPGITLEDDSQAICSDPYDSSITLLDEDVEDDLVDDLKRLDVYRDVHTKHDLWDEGDQYFDGAPDIVPERAEGVFVSGNIHPDPIGMGWYRTGVHDKYGCYGSTVDDLGGGTVTPIEMNEILEDYLDIDRGVNPIPNATNGLTSAERRAVIDDLSNE